MEDEQIYVIVIIVFIIISCYGYSLYSTHNKFRNDIFQYSLMIHLDNDKLSEERIQKVKKIYDEYDLPMNLMKATHWKKDIEELKQYPLDRQSIIYDNGIQRNGAYGLAGSFYKCLKKAHDEGWPYLLIFEDDAVPILPKDQFHTRFNEVLDSLPDNGTGIYLLGITVYCKTRISDKKEWIKYKDIKHGMSGTHSIYFGKKSIELLVNTINNRKIDRPIDHYLNDMNPWIWYGDLSENGMFRGLYKQLGMDCNNVYNLPGPINSS